MRLIHVKMKFDRIQKERGNLGLRTDPPQINEKKLSLNFIESTKKLALFYCSSGNYSLITLN